MTVIVIIAAKHTTPIMLMILIIGTVDVSAMIMTSCLFADMEEEEVDFEDV